MSSGRREIVFNTQERAISVDLNRAQKFANQDTQELLRYLLNVSAQDDLDAGAVMTETTGTTSPLRAEIINGLMVKPQVGTLFCTFESGLVLAIAPDTGVDDSAYKYIRHVATGETVLIAANAAGSTRIDVIECRPSPAQSQVSDSRDVFNPSTGLFTAAQVVKETKGYLEFRSRQGTAGSGFPGTVAGWLPIAIASVPTGSVNNDTVTFWDVRPLIADREFAPFALSSALPSSSRVIGDVAVVTAASDVRFAAKVDAVLDGRRLGGRLRRGSPGTDAEFLNIAEAANEEGSGIVWPGTSSIYFVYLATPFGLPRWARYTDASAGSRVPRSPRGIPIVSFTGPQLLTGRPSAPLTLPASCGFAGAMTSSAVCFWASGGVSGQKGYAAIANGEGQMYGDNGQTINVAGTNVGGLISFLATENIHFPASARWLYVRLAMTITFPAGDTTATLTDQLTVYKGSSPDPTNQYVHQGASRSFSNGTGGAINVNVNTAIMRIPLQLNYPNTAGFSPSSRLFDWQTLWLGTVSGAPAPRMRIVGWDF